MMSDGLGDLGRHIERLRARWADLVQAALVNSTGQLKRQIALVAPRNRGTLIDAWLPKDLAVVAGDRVVRYDHGLANPLEYARVMDLGRAPGTITSVKHFVPWVEDMLRKGRMQLDTIQIGERFGQLVDSRRKGTKTRRGKVLTRTAQERAVLALAAKVARGIYRKGIEARHYIRAALDQARPLILQEFREMIRGFRQDFLHG